MPSNAKRKATRRRKNPDPRDATGSTAHPRRSRAGPRGSRRAPERGAARLRAPRLPGGGRRRDRRGGGLLEGRALLALLRQGGAPHRAPRGAHRRTDARQVRPARIGAARARHVGGGEPGVRAAARAKRARPCCSSASTGASRSAIPSSAPATPSGRRSSATPWPPAWRRAPATSGRRELTMPAEDVARIVMSIIGGLGFDELIEPGSVRPSSSARPSPSSTPAWWPAPRRALVPERLPSSLARQVPKLVEQAAGAAEQLAAVLDQRHRLVDREARRDRP